MMHLIYLIPAFLSQSFSTSGLELDLPEEHLPFYFSNYPSANVENIPVFDGKNCWGYEQGCERENRYSSPICPGDHKGWVQTKADQENTFYTQADFGFVQQQLRDMKTLCSPLFQHDSILECSAHLEFCRGRNIMINFTSLASRNEPLRYKMDVLGDGDIGM